MEFFFFQTDSRKLDLSIDRRNKRIERSRNVYKILHKNVLKGILKWTASTSNILTVGFFRYYSRHALYARDSFASGSAISRGANQ